MSVLALFGFDEQRLGDLDYDKAELLLFDTLKNESTCELRYPATLSEATGIREGHSFAFMDRSGAYRLYDIVRVETVFGGSRALKVAYGEARYYEMGSDNLRPRDPGVAGYTFASSTLAATVMDDILTETRWTRGETVTTLRTFVFNDIDKPLNPLEALYKMAQIWGAELRFNVDITATGTLALTVDLVEQVGSFTGFRIETGYNLQSAKVEDDIEGLVTALYGFGFDASGSPLPVQFKEDTASRDIYGKSDGSGGRRHRYGVHYSEAQTATELESATELILNRRKLPRNNIQVTGADIDNLITLGDTGHIIISPDLKYEARIIEHRQNLKDKSQDVLTFGEFLPLGTD